MVMSEQECRALEKTLNEEKRRGSGSAVPRAGGLIPSVHWSDLEALRRKVRELEARLQALEEKG